MQAYILAEDSIHRTNDLAAVQRAHAAGQRLWVDLGERTPEADLLLAKTFKIHPLIAEDIWADRSVPKVDPFPEYLYIVIHGVPRGSTSTKLDLAVLDLVVGNTFLITQHRGGTWINAVAEELERSPRLLRESTAWLAHALIDRVVDRFLPLIDEIGAEIDAIERHVIEHSSTVEADHEKDILTRIFALRRSIQSLSRIAGHQTRILQRLSVGEFARIPPDALPFYRDIYEHFSRVTDLAELYRDVVTNTLDAYLSVQANHMNQDVKRLTLISTVTLPLSLVASFYGMNFRYMPGTEDQHGYLFVLGVMAMFAITIVWWFKRKKWL